MLELHPQKGYDVMALAPFPKKFYKDRQELPYFDRLFSNLGIKEKGNEVFFLRIRRRRVLSGGYSMDIFKRV